MSKPITSTQSPEAQVKQKPTKKPPRNRASGIPRIVGIGASASGLEALEAFLSHMPADSGLAFVIIQHLDPIHKGVMPELLQRITPMRVSQADNRMKVAAKVPGSGQLILTGQLGDVMKESAQAALSLVKSHATALSLDPHIFKKHDIHVHVPAGAIPKDGPSAGVAMFTALYSAFSERTVKSDIAMTGEVSLRGMVLPVGGIKEKVIAAARAGITTVMLPARNQRDFEEIPETVRKQLNFVWLERVEDALQSIEI